MLVVFEMEDLQVCLHTSLFVKIPFWASQITGISRQLIMNLALSLNSYSIKVYILESLPSFSCRIGEICQVWGNQDVLV